MNKNLWLLAAAQGLFLTNNVVFIAINGLVGLALAPLGWMATLPVMGYVVGGALSTGLVARTQSRWGRQVSFQLGLAVALVFLGWVLVWLRSKLYDNSDTSVSGGSLLDEYREMVRQGELSEEEFRLIKSRLGGRVPQGTPPAVRSDTPPEERVG